jgi:hypothetical protein
MVHTLCGKVQGSMELGQLAHIVIAGHQKIMTTQYVCTLMGLQGDLLYRASPLHVDSTFFSERPVATF